MVTGWYGPRVQRGRPQSTYSIGRVTSIPAKWLVDDGLESGMRKEYPGAGALGFEREFERGDMHISTFCIPWGKHVRTTICMPYLGNGPLPRRKRESVYICSVYSGSNEVHLWYTPNAHHTYTPLYLHVKHLSIQYIYIYATFGILVHARIYSCDILTNSFLCLKGMIVCLRCRLLVWDV